MFLGSQGGIGPRSPGHLAAMESLDVLGFLDALDDIEFQMFSSTYLYQFCDIHLFDKNKHRIRSIFPYFKLLSSIC